MYIVENHWIIWGTKVPKIEAARPWLKAVKFGAQAGNSILARLWIDQDLKKEMGY